MPAKTRTSKLRAEGTGLTPLQWEFLTDQLDRDDPRSQQPEHKWRFYELFANRTLATCEPIVDRLWAEHGAAVLRAWIAEHPGTRPSLWWVYDAPQERRRVSTAEPDVFEAQATYLARLGLLTATERRRMDAFDYEPVRLALEPEEGDDA